MFLVALVFLLFTTGWTEDFVFRGVLQGRIAAWTGSPWTAALITSPLLGLYHLPYAYLNPHWPSHGDLAWAFRLAMFEGTLGRLVLGVVYLKARGNLLACVVVHALIDVLPAMPMIKFGGGE